MRKLNQKKVRWIIREMNRGDLFPHMSLDFENAETPREALLRKMPPENLLGAASKYFGW
ncbi:MAG: hypothetical protein V1875_04680 [Candidatus Altiarchaeota archaeon]